LGDEVSDLIGIKHHEFVYSGHAWITHIRRKAHLADSTAAQQDTEELVQVGEKTADKTLALNGCAVNPGLTYYWFELALLAGRFIIRGAAPPPSRKLTEAGILLTLVDSRHPLKYGSRFTCSPPYTAGARIPGLDRKVSLPPTVKWS
jgi:hypothetical protein